MDPFCSIVNKTKSPTAFGKKISFGGSGGSNVKNDGIKKFSRTAKDSASNIAKRTRSNAIIVDGSVFIGGYTRKDGIVRLKGCSSSSSSGSGRKRKGLGGDGGNQWFSPDLGYGERKRKRGNSEPVIVVLDGDESEEECTGRSGSDEGVSSSENMENFDMGRQAGSGSLGVKDDNVVRTNTRQEEVNCIARRTRSKKQVQRGAVENRVSIDIDKTHTSCDPGDKNDDYVDEDLGVKKSHIEPSSSSTEEEDEVAEDMGVKESHMEPPSSSTEEEDEETNALSKISSSKNDYSSQSSTDDSGNNDDSEDEDFGIDESHGEPSSSSDDEEGTSDSEISRKRTIVRKWQETFVRPQMTKFGCQNRTNIDSVPIVLDEPQSSGDDIDDCSDEYYGNDSHIKETTSHRRDVEEGKHNSGKSQIKRRRYSGLDILIPSDVEEDASCSVPSENCVARRTRSHKGSRLGNKQKKLGTLSHPICFDVEDDNSYTENDEEDDDRTCSLDKSDSDSSIPETFARNATDDNINSHGGTQVEDGGKRKEDAGKSAKRKRVCAPKDVDHIFTALINSIWDKEEGEVLLENLTSKYQIPRQPIHPSVVETKLPYKFSFGIKKPIAEEKSAFDKELDRLWAELDFALNSSEIGSFGSSLVDDGDTNTPETETNLATFCSQGKHQLILDEDIGIRCRLCSFVKLELKYILPSWAKCPSGRSYQQTFSAKGDDSYMLDELEIQDNVGASQPHIFAEGTVWDIIPGLRNRMYPHQREGFEFMWKNLAGGIELEMLNKSRSSDGVGGCVISHAPGTGKTLLTIVFLLTYMKVYPDCQPVIIAPTGILLTWEEEFKKWKVDIPFHNLNKSEISGKEIPIVLGLAQRYGSVNQKRMLKLYSWSTQMSILGISYRLFGELVGEGYAKGGKMRQRIQHDTLCKEIRKILLEKPGLLILDEGHTPRNHRTCIWKAVSKIETKKRIILSGTPFQNNFQELYNILCLVRPKFTDVIRSKGKWSSLTCSDDGLEKLRGMLDPFVHVHRGTILKDNLPGLRNWTIYLRPTPLQKELLDRVKGVQNTFELEHQLALLSVHPSLWMNIEDPLSAKNDLNRRPDEGVKIRFLMELIRLIKPTEERVLVFSQYLEPLRFIKKQLLSYFSWVEGKEVLQMDGEDKSYQKQSSINIFNDPESDARILLASTRACSEGIHLIGASRVVLLDTVWNPSVEKQAISRAYRLGQKRCVYTYHLITVGTKEEEQYAKQVKKEEISKLVFSSRHLHHERINASSRVPDDNILREMYENIKLKDIFIEILSRE